VRYILRPLHGFRRVFKHEGRDVRFWVSFLCGRDFSFLGVVVFVLGVGCSLLGVVVFVLGGQMFLFEGRIDCMTW